MNIYKDRLWLALLTGIVSLCMGFCEFYTWRIGWHPGSSPWNRESLLHVSHVPEVLLLGVLTFGVLSLFMKEAGALPTSWGGREAYGFAFCPHCGAPSSGVDALFPCFLSGDRDE